MMPSPQTVVTVACFSLVALLLLHALLEIVPLFSKKKLRQGESLPVTYDVCVQLDSLEPRCVTQALPLLAKLPLQLDQVDANSCRMIAYRPLSTNASVVSFAYIDTGERRCVMIVELCPGFAIIKLHVIELIDGDEVIGTMKAVASAPDFDSRHYELTIDIDVDLNAKTLQTISRINVNRGGRGTTGNMTLQQRVEPLDRFLS